MNHKINMSQGAVNLLRNIISGTGWAKTTQDIILGGGLLADTRLPEYENIPTEKKAAMEWAKAPAPEFEVSEKEREAVKRAITHFCTQGALPIGLASAELLKVFGFTAE